MVTDTSQPLRHLLAELIAGGQLAPQWVSSFRALPWHLFIPDTVWVPHTGEGPPVMVLRRDDCWRSPSTLTARLPATSWADPGSCGSASNAHRAMLFATSSAPNRTEPPCQGPGPIHPYGVAGDHGAQLAISLRVPRCRHVYAAEAADRWWVDAGRPDADRWRFTVTPTGQRVELD